MPEFSRPLDHILTWKGKKVAVKLKNGDTIQGKLLAIDIHLNTLLEKAEGKSGPLIRGDTIALIDHVNSDK